MNRLDHQAHERPGWNLNGVAHLEHGEMVTLIRGGVRRPGGLWADLGAGTGNFTRALAELLGKDATIFAIDRNAQAIKQLSTEQHHPGTWAKILPRVGDFTLPLELPSLDGIMLANALHFVQEQTATLKQLAQYLRPGSSVLLIEYDVRSTQQCVPFPLPFERLQTLFPDAGLSLPSLVGLRRSPSSGIAMYAAVAIRPVPTNSRTP